MAIVTYNIGISDLDNKYLEVQDDGPYQAQYYRRSSVDQIGRVYIH